LEEDLFTHLLHLLRALPTLGLSPDIATDTCAAASAVLANICIVTRQHSAPSLGLLTAQILTVDVVAAIVQYGMLSPTSTQQPLPPIHVEGWTDISGLVQATADSAGTRERHQMHGVAQFWTPLRVCGFLLSMAITEADSSKPSRAAPGITAVDTIKHVMGQLADAEVYRHLLETTLILPCGELENACRRF
jgi:hypothetical protein